METLKAKIFYLGMTTHGVTNSKNQTLVPGLMLITVQMTAEPLLLEKNVLTGKFSYKNTQSRVSNRTRWYVSGYIFYFFLDVQKEDRNTTGVTKNQHYGDTALQKDSLNS